MCDIAAYRLEYFSSTAGSARNVLLSCTNITRTNDGCNYFQEVFNFMRFRFQFFSPVILLKINADGYAVIGDGGQTHYKSMM